MGQVCPGDHSTDLEPWGRLSAPGSHCFDHWETAVVTPVMANVLLAPHIFCRWPTWLQAFWSSPSESARIFLHRWFHWDLLFQKNPLGSPCLDESFGIFLFR